VAPDRIRKVMVDGGMPVVANHGDDETSLDVEQAGGLAPGADIRVYIASQTSNNGFLDLFHTAVSQNKARQLGRYELRRSAA
jgi:kumamolisin